MIAHRRKVWVFHGTKDGPQFKDPSNVLKTADDVTTMLTVDLNEDKFVDLVIIKVEVPSVATIMTGFFGGPRISTSTHSAICTARIGNSKSRPLTNRR